MRITLGHREIVRQKVECKECRTRDTAAAAVAAIITPNYGGFKKRTGLNFGGYTESNSTSRIKLRVR